MKTKIRITVTALIFVTTMIATFAQAQVDNNIITKDIPNVIEYNYKPESRVWWAKIAQCQLKFHLEKTDNGLYKISQKEVTLIEQKIASMVDIAIANKSNIIVFPELVLAFDETIKTKIVNKLVEKAKDNDLIIICGSFYNKERKNSSVIITPDGELNGDKIRPSRIETNPLNGHGMKIGDNIAFVRTKYGNFIVVTCVDLISDDVQYIIRKLANLGMIDICININYNPSAWEFMREASAIVKRHPLFFTITNVDNPDYAGSDSSKGYGHTSVFASTFKENGEDLKVDSSSPFAVCQESSGGKKCERHPAYEMLIASIPPGKEGMLVYDLNLRLLRTPSETNAPDQGYPPIKNIQTILLPEIK